eukprot:m.215504 g.215504  ORF g.215504 m.215504 type:complete len:523 (+) comp10148_c0_seq81:71-1639(+)
MSQRGEQQQNEGSHAGSHTLVLHGCLPILATAAMQGDAAQCVLREGPLRVHALVEVHDDRVVGPQRVVEHALHVPVSADALLDVAAAAKLGRELDRLEPGNVLGREEHVAHDRRPLVDLEGVAAEANALDDHAVGVDREHGSCRDQADGAIANLLEDEDGRGREDRGGEERRDGKRAGLEEALELVLVARTGLREDRAGAVCAGADDPDEGLLRADGRRPRGVHLQVDVQQRHAVLVPQQREHAGGRGRRGRRGDAGEAEGDELADLEGGGGLVLLRGHTGEHALAGAGKVRKLEEARVVERQILLGIPRRVAEALQAAVLDEALACRLVLGRVHLVGELAVRGRRAEGLKRRLLVLDVHAGVVLLVAVLRVAGRRHAVLVVVEVDTWSRVAALGIGPAPNLCRAILILVLIVVVNIIIIVVVIAGNTCARRRLGRQLLVHDRRLGGGLTRGHPGTVEHIVDARERAVVELLVVLLFVGLLCLCQKLRERDGDSRRLARELAQRVQGGGGRDWAGGGVGCDE